MGRVDPEEPAVFWSLLGTGVVLGASGIVLAAINIVAALNDEDFTVSLGGLLLGVGVGLGLLAVLKRRFQRIARAGGAMVMLGPVVAGWALGGGLDELFQDHPVQLILATLLFVVSVGVTAGGFVVSGRRT